MSLLSVSQSLEGEDDRAIDVLPASMESSGRTRVPCRQLYNLSGKVSSIEAGSEALGQSICVALSHLLVQSILQGDRPRALRTESSIA